MIILPDDDDDDKKKRRQIERRRPAHQQMGEGAVFPQVKHEAVDETIDLTSDSDIIDLTYDDKIIDLTNVEEVLVANPPQKVEKSGKTVSACSCLYLCVQCVDINNS